MQRPGWEHAGNSWETIKRQSDWSRVSVCMDGGEGGQSGDGWVL